MPYSFASAFEQGFFSDLIISAENGKEVSCCHFSLVFRQVLGDSTCCFGFAFVFC